MLLDRDCWRQSFEGVDIRLLHHREELPGVRRQRFDIAPLTLGINGVEGERGLAGTRKAGEDDQSIARQVEIDIFQVMGPGTPDADILHVTDYYTRGVKCGWSAPNGWDLAARHRPISVNICISAWGNPGIGVGPGVYHGRPQIVSGRSTKRRDP